MAFAGQFLKEDPSPSAALACACCEDAASALRAYTLPVSSLHPLDFASRATRTTYSPGDMRFGKWNQVYELTAPPIAMLCNEHVGLSIDP